MTAPPRGRLLDTAEEIRELFAETRTIAVAGLSEKPDRDSHAIAAYLQRQGLRIIGVNPKATNILGEPCYPSLSAIPEGERRQIDLVAIFRRPDDVPGVIAEAARLGLKRAWLVPGAESREGLEACAAQGLDCVAGHCLRTAHMTLAPGPLGRDGAARGRG
jgi:predicted CoA-binding protein